jgi:hypothetical protein
MDEELHNLHCLTNINWVIKSLRRGVVARTEDKINTYKILVRKPVERRSLGRRWHSGDDNIKTEVLKEIKYDDVG